MTRDNFTRYDEYPEAMLAYLRNYGPHFNRKLFEFAVKGMTKWIDGKEQNITPFTKDNVENILNNNGVNIRNGQLYDCAYIANMCKADFLGSSITDERHLALYIKDVIDDIDAPDGLLFNRFYADCCYSGVAIPWEDVL